MSTMTQGLDELLARLGDNERRAAKRTGQHIDAQLQMMRQLKEEEAAPLAFPVARPEDYKSITDADLKKLLKAHGVRGYTSRNGKRLNKPERVALAVEHGIAPLSYGFLLDFYLQHTR